MPKITKDRGPSNAVADRERAARQAAAGAAPGGGQDEAVPPSAATTSRPARPPKSALKAVWVAYAEALGFDPEGLSKAAIIDATEDL